MKKTKQVKETLASVEESIEHIAKQEVKTFVAKEDSKSLAEKLDRAVFETLAVVPAAQPAVSLAPLPGPVPPLVYVSPKPKSRFED
jgi:chromosome segregation and condensation protein ScpB